MGGALVEEVGLAVGEEEGVVLAEGVGLGAEEDVV